jgi:anthranilate phosphoribosyltransferase
VLFNSAASLHIAGRAGTLKQGVEIASHSLDSGAAKKTLDALVRVTNDYSKGPSPEGKVSR